jgi:hypothetical protein
MRGTSISDQNNIPEIVSHAQSWAFACEAAQTTTRDYIGEKIAFGTQLTVGAEATLKEIYEIMNQDYEDVTGDNRDDNPDEGDIWASDIKTMRRMGKQAPGEKRPKGPWSGLNGKVAATGEL